MSSRLRLLGNHKFFVYQAKTNRSMATQLEKLKSKTAEMRQEIMKRGKCDNTVIKIQMNITGIDF